MWISLSVNAATVAISADQARAKLSRSVSCQCVLRHRRRWHRRLLHRPDQTDAALHLAIIEHQATGRHPHGGAARLTVDQGDRAGIGETLQRLIECDRTIALALGNGQKPCLG